MRKLTSDALAPAALRGTLRRVFERLAAYPFTGSAVLLVLALLAIVTDVAARFGFIPFALMLAVHLRRVRGASS